MLWFANLIIANITSTEMENLKIASRKLYPLYGTTESLKVRFIVTYIQTIYVLATYVATWTIWLCLGIVVQGDHL